MHRMKSSKILNASRKKTKLYYNWIFSYVTILLIPIIICSYYYIHTYRLVKKNNVNQQTMLLEKTTDSLDKRFDELSRVATRVQLMNYTVSLSYATDAKLTSAMNSYISDIQNDFHLFRVANDMITDISIYFPNINRIVSSETVYTCDLLDYMDTNYFNRDDLTNFQNYLSKVDAKTCFLYTSKESNELYFVKRLLSDNSKLPVSMIIFTIDSSYLREQLKNNYLVQSDTELAILFENQLIMSTNDELTQHFRSQDLSFTTNPETLQLMDANYVISNTNSCYPDIQVISFTKQSVYNSNIYYLIEILIITILICLIVGIFTTYFYTRRNYRPVKSILDYIGESNNLIKGNNEYRLILDKLSKNRNELDEQKDLIRNDFLRKLLSGEILYHNVNDSVKNKFNFSLDASQVILAIIHVKNYTSYQQTVYQSDDMIKSTSLTHFIIQNILHEMLDEKCPNVYFCILGSDITVLCNSNQNKQQFSHLFMTCLEQLRAFLTQHYRIDLTIGVSDVVQNKDQLSETFTQATDALEYIHFFANTPICSYSSLIKSSNIQTIALGSSDVICNLVISNDITHLKTYFDQKKNEIKSQPLSIDEAKDIIYFFYRSSLQIKAQIYKSYGSGIVTNIDAIDRSIFSYSLLEAVDLVTKTYINVANQLANLKIENNDSLKDTVCKYIENNYSDINLNLNSIAQHFDLSPSYLSKRFRSEGQQSIIDYLYKIRIEQAIKLLSESNLKITDIASIVGFQDSNAFIRIFKKELGITPGKYRELNVNN